MVIDGKAPTQIQARHQFWISRKIGYGTRLNCWCGSSIPVDYSRGYVRQTQAVNTFAENHAECKPKEQEQSA